MNDQTANASSKRRVFLVDDHPMVRERLAQAIQRNPALEVCGEADDAPDALQAILKVQPHVVVVDLSLKRSHGLELIKNLQIHCPDLPVLVLSMYDETLYALRALRAGALGYITKVEPTKEVVSAIQRVLDGEMYLSETMQRRIAEQQVGRGKNPHPIEDLSDRELEVFQMLGRGFGTRRIAEELGIGIKSVEAYRARIKEKLGLKDATELLFHAIHCAHNLH